MAIDLYSGTPGSGKSLHSAKRIVDWSRAGKPVITNFDVDLSKYPKANQISVDDDDLTPDFLVKYSREYFQGRKLTKKDEDTILLVIDECQLIFNSREYQKKDRKAWIKFFSTHRHLGYHVILIAQMDKMLDKQIRGLIEYEYVHRKLSNFGKAGKLLTVFLAGEMFTSVQMWYPLKLKIGTQMFRAKKRYYSIYDSYAAFGDPKELPAPEGTQDVSSVPEGTQDVSSAPEGFQEASSSPELKSEPEVKQGEVVVVDSRSFLERLLGTSYEGRYLSPGGQIMFDFTYQGKFLRPGGRTEFGWR